MRLLLTLVVAVALAVGGCDKGQAEKPAPAPAAPDEKGASAKPGGPSATEAPAPAPAVTPLAVTSPDASSAAVAPQAEKQIEAVISTVTVEGASPPPKTKAVDNSRCHVCHLNFSDDVMAVNHAKYGVGCEKCHGPSDDHASDEGNVTPPQIMYPREKIDAACKVCHPDPMERIVADAKYCLHVLVTEEEKKKVCTDCHGAHKMAQRQVRWNKTTGEVLPQAPPPPKAAAKS